jgi:hypothetical protein
MSGGMEVVVVEEEEVCGVWSEFARGGKGFHSEMASKTAPGCK